MFIAGNRTSIGSIAVGALIWLSASLAAGQFGTFGGLQPAKEVNVEAALISAYETFVPGEPILVGLHLKHAPHWHTYWEYAGDAGLPTTITWDLPEGFEAGPIQWPAPIIFEAAGIIGYGYEGEAVLPVAIQTPPTWPEGQEVTLKGMARWLECKELCIPGSKEISLTLAAGPTATPSPHAELIQSFVERVPRPIDGDPALQFAVTRVATPKASSDPFKIELALTGEALDAARADVFALFPIPDDNLILDSQPEARVSGRTARFTVEGVATPFGPDYPNLLQGVIRFAISNEPEPQFRSFETTVTAPATASAVAAATTSPTSLPPATPAAVVTGPSSFASYLWMIALAFAGGLILNIMPCVLPVISLKVFAFVKQANESRGRIFFLGVMYGLGVLASFWILAGVMIALKIFGSGANWGVLFQYPPFVIAFAAVVFVFALNMLGVFEIYAPGGAAVQGMAKLQHREGPVGAFFTGVLATLLATPCTAPILGVAITFALSQPSGGILLMFTSIGFGMAFPFLLLAAFPAWTRLIPKPGMWMIRFKQVMGFILMGTAIWLAWLVGQLFQAEDRGVGALGALLTFLLALAVGVWMIGTFIDYSSSRRRRWTVWVLALLLAGFTYSITVHRVLNPRPPAPDSIQWVNFTPDTLEKHLASNDLIFMDFTADWCLTCKSNEKLVLETSEVRGALRRLNAIPIKADFTRQDPEILRMLESFGRSGVPLYVIYPPNGGQPIVLPEIITRQMVIDKLNEAAQWS